MGKLADRVLTRRQIEGMIAEGKAVFIYDGNVHSVNAWMKYHPGGDKAIRHMIGRDATDEVRVLHSEGARQRMKNYIIGRVEGPWKNFLPPIQGGKFRPYTGEEDDSEFEEPIPEKTLQLPEHIETESSGSMSSSVSEASSDEQFILDPSLRRRRGQSAASSVTSVDTNPPQFDPEYLTRKGIEEDLAKYPSLDSMTQREIVQKYRALEHRIRAAGLYDCNYWAYGREIFRYLLLFSTALVCLKYGWYKTSAFFIGAFWHQLVFSAHDAGHMGITHDFQTDTCIGIFIANFCGGLSLGWWKRSHNVHHIITNSPEHDPDIEHLPFLSVSHKFFGNVFSTYYDRVMPYDSFAQFFVKHQHKLYYIVLLFGRFNLYRLSLEYLIVGLGPKRGPAAWHRWLEFSGLVFFWYWFGYGILYHLPTNWDRFAYVMISHMVTMPLHLQITLSHFAMSTADLGITESFPQRMLRTTMDVDCSPWVDFFHGGLQFQAIHHLYPRIPRHNLRATQKLVIEFCKEVGIPYTIYGFYEGNKELIGHLAEIARQAKFLAECQKHVATSGDLHF